MENNNIDNEQEELKVRVQENLIRQKNIKDAIEATEEEREREIQEDLKARVQENLVRQKKH